MRLIDNNVGYNKLNRLYWIERHLGYSNYNIRNKQNMDIRRLLNSNYLLMQLYDEIKR
jgi:hypothetical protein